ncbi:hypothetical protein ACFLWZ_08620 [Chloroflexota bacterium]
MGKSEEIIILLAEGNTSKNIIDKGYKKGTVYGTQRKWRQGKVKTPTGGHDDAPRSAVPTAHVAIADIDIEADPEIIKLKKEIRKAELEKQLDIAEAPPDLETLLVAAHELGRQQLAICKYEDDGLCTLFQWESKEEIPQGIGEPISVKNKEWQIKPSPLYCAMCSVSLEGRILELEDSISQLPLHGLRERFTWDCGGKGEVAVSIKCTKCGEETWWGWWPKEQ